MKIVYFWNFDRMWRKITIVQNYDHYPIIQKLQLNCMTSFEKIFDFASKVQDNIFTKTAFAFEDLGEQIGCIEIEPIDQFEENKGQQQLSVKHKEEKQFEGLDDLELIQSRAVQNQASSGHQQKNKKRRIKQIQEQKRKIAMQLKQIDEQIEDIKGKNQENAFKKRQKIQKNQDAQKHAQILVKQLQNQRKQIQNRKRQQFEKSLLEMQKQDEERRKIRQQEALRAKQQRRLAILQRMQQQKKRKQQRKMIQAQSNQLIAKLKKQQQLTKIASMAPSQIVEVDNRRKVLQKKNNFDFRQIEEHDRKYRQLKQRSKKQKEERAQSLKVNRSENSHKYSRNVWIERIQEEQLRKKQQQKQNQEKRKSQLEKRLKYGQLVKNIFLPKRKDKQNNDSSSVPIKQQDEIEYDDQKQDVLYSKPRTPQQLPALPKVKLSSNKTQNSKLYRQQSLPGIKNSKKLNEKKISVKQFDPQEEEKQKVRKIRELELRKQTKERLKKLESQSANKGGADQQERKKYKNYLGEVKVKKDQANEWKKIMNNDKLTQEQKYQQLIRKAGDLEAKAKKKQDKTVHRQADQESVNLYIGSIQAKLALLKKF